MRGSKGYDEAVLECKWHIKSHERTRALAEVPNVILAIIHVVLDDQMPVSYAIIVILLNHEVVADVAADRLLERSEDRAPVVFAT